MPNERKRRDESRLYIIKIETFPILFSGECYHIKVGLSRIILYLFTTEMGNSQDRQDKKDRQDAEGIKGGFSCTFFFFLFAAISVINLPLLFADKRIPEIQKQKE